MRNHLWLMLCLAAASCTSRAAMNTSSVDSSVDGLGLDAATSDRDGEAPCPYAPGVAGDFPPLTNEQVGSGLMTHCRLSAEGRNISIECTDGARTLPKNLAVLVRYSTDTVYSPGRLLLPSLSSDVTVNLKLYQCGTEECRYELTASSAELQGWLDLEGPSLSEVRSAHACLRASKTSKKTLLSDELETRTMEVNMSLSR